MSSANIYNEDRIGSSSGSSIPTSSPWSTVLSNGNLSGPNIPTITAGQSIIFQSGIRIGGNNNNTDLTDTNGVSIGSQASAQTGNSIAIGPSAAITAGGPSIAIGSQTIANGAGACISIGQLSVASGSGSISIGSPAPSSGTNSIRIGNTGAASGNNSLCIGWNSTSAGIAAVTVGSASNAGNSGAVRIGPNGSANIDDAVCIGNFASCATAGTKHVAVGFTAVTSEERAVVVGANSSCASSGGIVVGGLSSIPAGSANSLVVGLSSTVTGGLTGVTVVGNAITGNQAGGFFCKMRSVAGGLALNYDAANFELRSTPSSSRYKRDIKDLDDPMLILRAQAREFKYVDNHCGCFEKDGKCYTADLCEDEDECCKNGECDYTESGLIAEELDAIGLDKLVCYSFDEEGKKQCESVRYERVAIYLLEVVKALHSRVEALEREIIV